MATYESSFILNDKVSPALKAIVTNCRKMDRDLGRANKSLEIMQRKFENIGKLGNKIKDVGKGLTVGVTLPIVAMGGAMVKLATDMEETINKVDVSFGSSSDSVKKWAKNSITSMGLAQQSALDSAALYGDMATGMGMSQEKAAEMAMSLTQLGADLASFKNISNDVAQTALKSIFTGETESLKNLGVVMTEVNLQNYASSQGNRKKIKDMTELEKIQLRYNYVLSRTTNAQGDFIRTGGGAANQTRMFQENLKELGVTFGTYILPYFTKAMVGLNKMLVSFGKLSPRMQKIILVAAGIGAAIGPLIIGIGGLITAIASLNTACVWLAANPIVLTIAAWTAGIVGLINFVTQLIRLIKILVNHFKEMSRIKTPSLNANFSNEEMQKLSAIQATMGSKAFAEKYGKDVAKAVNNYRTTNNTNNTTNSNNTTTNNNITNNNYNALLPLSASYST